MSSSTDDQGLAALARDSVTGELTAYYVGKTDGSETWPTSVNLYCKGSKDNGSTWGPETLLSVAPIGVKRQIFTVPYLFVGAGAPPPCVWVNDLTLDELVVNVDRTTPHAVSLAGVM